MGYVFQSEIFFLRRKLDGELPVARFKGLDSKVTITLAESSSL